MVWINPYHVPPLVQLRRARTYAVFLRSCAEAGILKHLLTSPHSTASQVRRWYSLTDPNASIYRSNYVFAGANNTQAPARLQQHHCGESYTPLNAAIVPRAQLIWRSIRIICALASRQFADLFCISRRGLTNRSVVIRRVCVGHRACRHDVVRANLIETCRRRSRIRRTRSRFRATSARRASWCRLQSVVGARLESRHERTRCGAAH
jgi:hypothetical protein